MANKSMIEAAYEIMQKKENIAFNVLWKEVCKMLNLSEEEQNKKVANFYTQLSLDGRFVFTGKNKWNLRDRMPFDKVHVDTTEVYKDMESEKEDSDDDDENEDSSVKKDEEQNNEEEVA